MKLKLYGSGISPYVRKVRVFLAEKGLDFEHDPMLPMGASDEYKAMHPLGKIPLLTDGDRVIPDSSAICAYLERVAPSPALYPSDPYEHARALWYEEFADAALVDGTGVAFRERLMVPLYFQREADQELLRNAEENVLPPYFDYLERNLGDAEYFAGNRFSIADVALGAQFGNYRYGNGEVDATRWRRLAAWLDRALGRPSFVALTESDRQTLAAMKQA